MTMRMPRERIQEHHTAMPGMNIVQFLGREAEKNGFAVPDTMVGVVRATLYRGLWIVMCPMDGCSGAVGVTSVNPVSLCPDCGAGWFKVLFPKNKAEIEAEVLQRPTTAKGLTYANWTAYGGRNQDGTPNGKGETMSQLRKQTRDILKAVA